ncbi:MAG: 4Fe-4S dicluster domain-containing protein [Thermincolia bacterium]
MTGIVDLVREGGVVGAGGAGFPTHIKIAAEADTVIVNGAECEPLLRVDQQLMTVEAHRLVKGLEAVVAVTGASTGIIALKAKYKRAIEVLTPLVAGKPIKIHTLEDFFPAGDEHVLVTGRVVPEAGIPLKVGCVVSNVETLINVAYALEGIPVTDTWLTVTGEVAQPVTLKAPIGTPVLEVLAACGVKDPGSMAVIDGGPMMGRVLEDVNTPVTKVTKGLIVLPLEHMLTRSKTLSWEHIARRSKSVCIQCAMCTDVCPRFLLGHRLEPHKIMRSLNYLKADEEIIKMALLCCECGACELYGCIMQLPPRQVNAAFKRELAGKGVRYNPTQPGKPVSPFREYRKIPSKRLVAKMGLTSYDQPAPLSDDVFMPTVVRIPLRQHIGVPAVPVVEAGQRIEKGALIATIPEGTMGANIHASINGVVKQVAEYIEIVPEGERGVKG